MVEVWVSKPSPLPETEPGGGVSKKLFRIKFGNDAEGYLVIDPTHGAYYNLDGVIYAQEPAGWSPVAALGDVETADDVERMTGSRARLFVEDCRASGRPALLIVDQDDGICAGCQGEGGEEDAAAN